MQRDAPAYSSPQIVLFADRNSSFRHIGVLKDEYAVSGDGMKMFGVLDLETGFERSFPSGFATVTTSHSGWPFTAGLRVTVCENMMFNGDFTPVLANIEELFSPGQPLHWDRPYAAQLRAHEAASGAVAGIADPRRNGKAIIYRAFVDGELEAPSSLMVTVHRNYFQPVHQEF